MLQKRRTFALLTAIMLVICMAFDKWPAPGNGQTIIKTLDGSIGQLKQDSVVLIEDPIFFDAGLQGTLKTPYKVQNMVSLEVNEDALLMIPADFKASVRLEIKKTNGSLQVTTSTVDLELDYKRDGASAQRKAHIFSNAYRVEVKVIHLNKGTANWDVFSALKIVNQLQSFPEFNFHCTDHAVRNISITGATPAENTAQDELPVNWPGVVQANEYDLEWTYIDSAALSSGRYGTIATPNPKLLFANNASRVTITGTSYRIPLFYDKKGHLFFRVRSVHWSSALGPEGGRMEADWSSSFTGGLGRFDYLGHEQAINWQSTTSFAEEGKRKSVVQYYDGSLRSRQTVTKDNVSNSTIATESFYDYQGRPVIQVMPVPTLKNVIGYTRGLNRSPGKEDYDKSLYDTLPDPNQYCGIQAVPMDSNGIGNRGASRYYSPANDSVAIPRSENRPIDPKFAYIPDAEQYPFTEVEYTQDNTGRINRQSGVGKTFRMGGGRETQYAYSTPDQKELDALFGTEVGYAAHYQKSIVRDANGQFSISYADMRGRTVATALVGTLPNDIKLDGLSSATLEPRVRSLSNPSSTIIRDLVMESRNSIDVTRDNAVHHFNYTLTPESVQLAGVGATTFCYDCLYDLQVTITSDCNNGKMPNGVAFDTLISNFSLNNIDTSCSPAQGFNVSFSLMLDKGIYEVTKKLSISQSSLDYYRDSLFMKRNRLRDLQSFIDEQRAIVNMNGGCKPECEGCLESIGTWESFWTSYKSANQISGADTARYLTKAKTAYNDARTSCMELCGTNSDSLSLRLAMMADLTPPYGQYAVPDKDWSRYSIFNKARQPYFRTITSYKDENGEPAMIYSPAAGKELPPQELSDKEFIEYFQESWATSLLPLHPEFCLLQRYEMFTVSHQWDKRFEGVETYAAAKQKGYLNPTGATGAPFNSYAGTIPTDNDPLATLLSGYFKSSLETAIGSNYKGSNRSLYSIAAISTLCPSGVNAACESNFAQATSLATSTSLCDADRDLVWNSFKMMYLQAKRELIQAWIRTQCPGAPTGKTLIDSSHSPHFGTAAELLAKEGIPIPTTPGDVNNQRAAAEIKAKEYYASNCKSYIEYWIKALGASCAQYDTADLRATVIPKLLKICMEGSDMDRPQGSSSVAPGSTYSYRSFDQVIREYNQLKNIKAPNCNAYTIEVPRPYDQQLPNSRKPVSGKPSDCECELINKYHKEYLKKTSRFKSFSEYMWKQYATIVEETSAQYLVALCNNTTIDCSIKQGIVSLPTAFQCGTGEICIDCEQFEKLDASFREMYQGILPSADLSLTDSTQRSWNKLYEQFMNYKLGYTKTAAEYLNFAAGCGIVQGPGCDSLNRIYNNFLTQRKEEQAVTYYFQVNSTEHFTDPQLIVENGTLLLPDSIRQRQGNSSWHKAGILAGNAKQFCAATGLTIEARARFLQNPEWGAAIKLISANGFGFSLARYNSGGLNGLYLVSSSGYGDPTLYGIEEGGNSNGFSRILVSTNTNILLDWFTLKGKITPSHYYIYFNDSLLVTLPRNNSLPIPDLDQFGLNFMSRQGNVDWFRFYNGNDQLQYTEDFNSYQGYTIPEETAYCPAPATDCKTSFRNYFNQQNNSSLNYVQIEALYRRICGKVPDPCGTTADNILRIVDRFNKDVDPTRIIPVLEGESLPAPDNFINDPHKNIRDGIFQYPASLQTNTDPTIKPYYAIHTAPGTQLCMSQGFSVETKAKFKTNPNGSQLAHLFTFEFTGNATAKILKGFPTTGIFLSDLWMRAPNGNWANYLTTPVKLMDDYNTFFDQWNTFKFSIDNDSARFYCNGIKVMALANPRGFVENSNSFSFSAGGYLAQYDWIKVRDKQGNMMMFEDFNDPDNLARFNSSFLCATAAPCQTAFVDYYNQQQSTNYSYVQIDSLYHHFTGRSLDVCGAMDSLLVVKRLYNNDANPYRSFVLQFMNESNLNYLPFYYHRNQESSFDEGIFKWPDYARDPEIYNTWWRYSNLLFAPSICAGDGFTVEGRVRALKDNIRISEENLTITIGANLSATLYKRTEPGTSRHGFFLDRINITKSGASGTQIYNVLPSGRVYPINGDPAFLSKQWHTFKIKVTKASITFYWNGILIGQGNIPQNEGYTVLSNFNGILLGFMGMHGAVDYVKLYNDKNELIVHEDFEDPNERILLNPDMLCPKPAVDCQTGFRNFFNIRNGTNYSIAKLDSLYRTMTGTGLNMCDFTAQKQMLCGRATSAFPTLYEDELTQCSDSTFFIQSKAQTFYNNYLDSLTGTFDSVYKAKCLDAYKYETFTVSDTASEYHYTLYYYDQAGNLVKTVPPSGVRPNRDPVWLDAVKTARLNKQSLTPGHELPTNYRYNSLNQVVAQKSPDGGMSKFWYDRLGRLVISQNAKQKYAATTEENRLYSYTRYDGLGRISEVGQVKNLPANLAMTDAISRSQTALISWLTALNQRREQITATVYDLPYPGFTGVLDNSQIVQQRNLRNRVSYTTYTDGWNIANYNQGTFYTYDIHGNVDTLLQDYGCGSCTAAEVFNMMNRNGNRFKKISYNYDLISGKVNSVAYQKGWSDQFFHRYSYDGENRLTLVETSMDGFYWDKDARYEYYLHGPLARTVLGNQQVQGIDYAYTLQGWLKGVNSSGATDSFDIGGDGRTTSLNRYVARDAFGFVLNYHGNDYKASNEARQSFPGYSAYLNEDFRPLYNGNISSMVSTNRIFENPAAYPDSASILFNYRYDQLNRITGMEVFNKFNRVTNSYSSLTKLDQFKERVSYDGHGNIQQYLRNGNGNGDISHLLMDSLTYSYYPGTNRLRHVRDAVPASWYGANSEDKIIDIDNQADTDNYIYDSIGNLIQDKAEKINNINWNVYGKITGISRGAGIQVPASEILYTYDAGGNRISKSVVKNSRKAITWYVRDAQGNVMTTYSSDAGAAIPLEDLEVIENERYIYGSSRLGVITASQNVSNNNAGPAAVQDTGGLFKRGERMYELSNHLGNVLVTISDRKKGVADPLNAALIKFFEPVMLSGTDYYPFGMAMRIGGDNQYKYGFNGKENDNEVKGGDGLQLDYGFRIYDPRLGKFLSVDPLTEQYPFYTPYQFAGNKPIMAVDLDGLEEKEAITITEEKLGKTALKVAWKEGNGKVVQMFAKGALTRSAFVNIAKSAGVGLILKFIVDIFTSPTTSPQDVAKRYPDVKGTPNEDKFWDSWIGPGRNLPLPPIDPNQRPQWLVDNWPSGMPISLPNPNPLPIVDSRPADDDDANKRDYITLYRGVSADMDPHVIFTLATKGIAYPLGLLPGHEPHENAEAHTYGDNNSIYTSWTMNRNIAEKFAKGRTKKSAGIVLEKKFKISQLQRSQASQTEHFEHEGEFLVPGVVTGASTSTVKPNP